MTGKMTPVTTTLTFDTEGDRRVRRREIAGALLLFVLACILIFTLTLSAVPRGPSAVLVVSVFFALLALSYLGLSVQAFRMRLRRVIRSPAASVVVAPGGLLSGALVYARAQGLPLEPRAGPYAAYLFVPAVLLLFGRHAAQPSPLQVLAAAAVLWLPIEFRLLSPLPLPAPDGYDAVRLLGIIGALYLFLVARPMGGIGYTFLLDRRDFRFACTALGVYAAVALPIGLISHFLVWHLRVDAAGILLTPVTIYLVTAVPEEFLFRGVIQNLFTRMLGPRAALTLASVVFGLAHLPDPRYVVLATFAGVAYGWVYLRTGKITASAVTHASVDWIWLLLLRR
jgi:CAAX protease family protein